MEERKQESQQDLSNEANRTHGPQGIDKAPGEEPSDDNVQFMQQALKGKKVDRDPDQEQDKPLENQDL